MKLANWLLASLLPFAARGQLSQHPVFKIVKYHEKNCPVVVCPEEGADGVTLLQARLCLAAVEVGKFRSCRFDATISWGGNGVPIFTRCLYDTVYVVYPIDNEDYDLPQVVLDGHWTDDSVIAMGAFGTSTDKKCMWWRGPISTTKGLPCGVDLDGFTGSVAASDPSPVPKGTATYEFLLKGQRLLKQTFVNNRDETCGGSFRWGMNYGRAIWAFEVSGRDLVGTEEPTPDETTRYETTPCVCETASTETSRSESFQYNPTSPYEPSQPYETTQPYGTIPYATIPCVTTPCICETTPLETTRCESTPCVCETTPCETTRWETTSCVTTPCICETAPCETTRCEPTPCVCDGTTACEPTPCVCETTAYEITGGSDGSAPWSIGASALAVFGAMLWVAH